MDKSGEEGLNRHFPCGVKSRYPSSMSEPYGGGVYLLLTRGRHNFGGTSIRRMEEGGCGRCKVVVEMAGMTSPSQSRGRSWSIVGSR